MPEDKKTTGGIQRTVVMKRDQRGRPTEAFEADYDYLRQNNIVSNDAGDVAPTAAGAQAAIDTLTLIFPKVIKQKFYGTDVERFIPRTHGLFTFHENIKTPLALAASADLNAGLIDLSTSQARGANVDVTLAWKGIKTFALQYSTTFSFLEIQKALIANNWNLIEAGLAAIVKAKEQQLMRYSFVGDGQSASGLTGLFNNPDMPVDTTTVTAALSGMTTAQLETFAGQVAQAFYSQNAFSGKLTTLVMGSRQAGALAAQNMGLISGSAAAFGPFTKLSYLAYLLTQANQAYGHYEQKVEILATPYADKATNAGFGLNKDVILAYNRDEEVLRQDIGFDLQPIARPQPDATHLQASGLRTFTGVGVYRPLETLRFQY